MSVPKSARAKSRTGVNLEYVPDLNMKTGKAFPGEVKLSTCSFCGMTAVADRKTFRFCLNCDWFEVAKPEGKK